MGLATSSLRDPLGTKGPTKSARKPSIGEVMSDPDKALAEANARRWVVVFCYEYALAMPRRRRCVLYTYLLSSIACRIALSPSPLPTAARDPPGRPPLAHTPQSAALPPCSARPLICNARALAEGRWVEWRSAARSLARST
jgi:hypothetical protein